MRLARWTPFLCLAALLVLAGCGSRPTGRTANYGTSSGYYPPPGPPEDPWGPYIVQASSRFGVPDLWIREVMRRESAGQQQAYSSAGAMGLMQVMPGTYSELQARHGLGDDPWDPRNNILAGTAYIREMYDRYGAPAFLAAYNAGPRRLEAYLYSRRDLPDETVNYVAAIAPRLGRSTPMSGPLAVYADPGAPAAPAPVLVAAAGGGGCDPDAAYDPSQPCIPVAQAVPVVAMPAAVPEPAMTVVSSTPPCDPDAAYDPMLRCAPVPSGSSFGREVQAEAVPPFQVAALVAPLAPALPPAGVAPFSAPPSRGAVAASAPAAGAWAVQVGAFSNPTTARLAAERARGAALDALRGAQITLVPAPPSRGAALFRSRLTRLSAQQAARACDQLVRFQLACIVVRPDDGRAL